MVTELQQCLSPPQNKDKTSRLQAWSSTSHQSSYKDCSNRKRINPLLKIDMIFHPALYDKVYKGQDGLV